MKTMLRASLITAAGLLLVSASPAPIEPKVGDRAPDFAIRLLDGGQLNSASLKGKVVVINLWATWCAPCKNEMPMLDYMQQRMGGAGLQVIGVLTDDTMSRQGQRRVAKVVKYPLAVEIAGKYPKLGGIPTTYVIDRKGVIRFAKAGELTAESFAPIIVPLINEKP